MSEFSFLRAIKKSWVNVTCPRCAISNRVMVREILVESYIVCKGCYIDLHLVQKDASGTRTESSAKRLDKEIIRATKDISMNLNL